MAYGQLQTSVRSLSILQICEPTPPLNEFSLRAGKFCCAMRRLPSLAGLELLISPLPSELLKQDKMLASFSAFIKSLGLSQPLQCKMAAKNYT